jgi:A/G-specific adenine glycosylase
MKPLDFSNKILTWYGVKKRDLPWRNTCNPYKIWISEVILQQTRIDQGIGYYYRFIEKFPAIFVLANAEEEEIMKIWQGLGYYSRARNLHKGAKMIVSDFDGVFPNSSEKMKSIKGIGDYTSAAIASIVFNEPIAAVDGNVYRVLSRIFGIETPIDTTSGKKIFSELANQLIATDKPGDFNQAVMELGALVCKPRNPNCEECVFNTKCAALATNTIDKLPVKSKKTKVTDRFFNYLLIVQGDFIYMNKRGENDIWGNLYDLPCIETENKTTITELMKTCDWDNLFKDHEIDVSTLVQHKLQLLSHQKINAQFVTITLPLNENFSSAFIRINKNDIFDFPVPVLIDKFFQEQIR